VSSRRISANVPYRSAAEDWELDPGMSLSGPASVPPAHAERSRRTPFLPALERFFKHNQPAWQR